MESTQTEYMVASMENMERMERYAGAKNRSLYAYSPTTHEEYSADPADYWNHDANWVMTDSEGEPMILCLRVSGAVPFQPQP